MEKNPEINDGNYTSHFRAYDSKIGRWWSVDPEANHFKLLRYSPYHSTYNNPIVFVDRNGDFPIPIIFAIGKAAVVGAGIGGGFAGAFAYVNDEDVGQAVLKGAAEGAIVVGALASFSALVAASGGISGGLYYGGLGATGYYSGTVASFVGQGMERDLFGTRGPFLDGREAMSDGLITALVAPVAEFVISFSTQILKNSTKAALKNPNSKAIKREVLKQFKKEIKKLPKSQRPKGKAKRNLRHGYVTGAKEAIREKNVAAKVWEVKATATTKNTATVIFDAMSKQIDSKVGEEFSLQRKEVEIKGRKTKTSSQTFTAG